MLSYPLKNEMPDRGVKLPTLSFANITARDPSAIRDLQLAACDWGIFYLEDSNISPALTTRVMHMSQRFFQLPVALKQRLSLNHRTDFRGYVALGEELTNGKPDMKESYEFARDEQRPADAQPQAFDRLYGSNPWPEANWLPGFKPVLEAYMTTIQGIATQLFLALIDALEIPPAHRDLQWTSPLHFRTRLIHYAQVEGLKRGDIRIAEHTDLAMLNLLRITAPGLEARHANGDWVDVFPRDNNLVVILGEFCQWWTRGKYRAGVHRVRQDTEHGHRTSMPFFFYPNLQSTLRAVDGGITPDVQHKRAGDVLLQRLIGVHPH